jgi:nucleoside-diphosphate-sugar epimerase
MKAFVTGGSGFVGKHLLKMLHQRGYTVKALARSEQAAKQVRDLGAEVVYGDLLNEQAMTQGMLSCDVVFHVAGQIQMWGSYKAFYENNVVGTERTLVAAQLAGVKRFVQIGASAVIMNKRPTLNVDEEWPVQQPAFSPYIATKSLAEQRVIAANAPEFITSVVRPAWIWGKGDHLLPTLLKAVRSHQFVWINQGNYPYMTTHVTNVCHGTILAAERGVGGQAYFLGDDEIIQFRDWVTKLLATEGVKPGNLSISYPWAWRMAGLMELIWKMTGWQSVPPLTRTTVRLIGQGFTFSDRKARTELGYTPIISRETGLAELAR